MRTNWELDRWLRRTWWDRWGNVVLGVILPVAAAAALTAYMMP